MKIIIPSRKRADTIGRRSLRLFPGAVVTVDEREMEEYAPIVAAFAAQGASLLPHPPLESLAEILNWIVDAFEDETVVVAEDDITRCVSFVGNNVRVYKDPRDVQQIVENAAEAAKGVGAHLFGFTDSANPKHFKPQDPLSFVANLYTLYGYVGKSVRSDPKRRLFRDMDTSLTELLNNRIVYCDARFHFESIAPLRQAGGNAVNRAREDLPAAIQFMQRKWGHYVRSGNSGDLVLNVGAIKRRQAKV